jgi:hypothetical protein
MAMCVRCPLPEGVSSAVANAVFADWIRQRRYGHACVLVPHLWGENP